MVFNSMTFLWIFLPIVLFLYFIVKEKYRNILLVIASIIFYAWGETKHIFILILSIIFNYIFGLMIDKTKGNKKKFVFAISIIANLALLCCFKYTNFLIENINRIFDKEILKQITVTLPIGISFFTFSAISYLFDLYKKNVKVQKNILHLALYISFFPKLIMGPIEKYSNFEKQIYTREITIEKFAHGIRLFIYGLGKKVILANSIGRIADCIFNANITSINMPIAWLGAFSYMIQIFFDFSGYSDMAVGIGKMFGFDLINNFNLPYLSQSITEFWRRWHISLSTWFKEYLYIPLGGNRKGKIRTYINLFIVFLATGIWHGAAWNFIAWGLFNGFFMILERIKLKEIIENNKYKFINHIYALFITLIGWVFFRSSGLKNALYFLKRMFIPTVVEKTELLDLTGIITTKNILLILVAILLSGILQSLFGKLKQKDFIKDKYQKFVEPILIVAIFVISIMSIVNGTYNSFIYFQF